MVTPINLVIVENNDKRIVTGRQYPELGEIASNKKIDYFPGNFGVVDAFDAAAHDGARVLFAPEVGLMKLGLMRIAGTGSLLERNLFLTSSSVSMGYSKGKAGKPVVAYAHIPTMLSDPVYVRQRIADKTLRGGAAEISREEFSRILENEGNGVIVVNYSALEKAGSGEFSLTNAAKHPQLKAFLGGDKTIIAQYLDAYKTVYGGRETIGVVGFRKKDFPAKAENPRGRLLAFGGNYNNVFSANLNFNGSGRVFGVRALKMWGAEYAQLESTKRPTLEEALQALAQYIPDSCMVQARTDLAKLYNYIFITNTFL